MITCATSGCTLPRSGKSKYCRDHKAVARAAWRAKVADDAQDRADRDVAHEDLYRRAVEAGRAAAEACTPTPMVVQEHANPLDDSSPVIKQYAPVMAGVCGFAWINVRPGNSSFACWLKRNDLGRSDRYEGGVRVWVDGYGQSYERKRAYAGGFARVLRDAGMDRVYPGSRLD